MQIRLGYTLIYECPQPTPMILTLNIHYTRVSDLVIADHILTSPPILISVYRDGFGNWCSRIVAPQGDICISTDALINDSGLPDGIDPSAAQHAVEDLPADTLVFLLGSRYCETDRLSETAWTLFGKTPAGWPRVQAICDFVHDHLAFDYTIPVHGEARGLPCAMIEIRQDGLRTAANAAIWAAQLAQAYRMIEAEALRFFEP